MFKKYNLKDYIYKGLEKINFYKPTEVQEKVIPLALNKNNIIGKSQTGTGKTHAFIIPILQNLNETESFVQSVIITPTRELAYQIFENINQLIKFSEIKIDVRVYVGGTNRDMEIAKLNYSQPQIVIGTIGKLTDLTVKTNLLKIHTASIVVIDEADMVFEISEINEIDNLFSRFQDFQVLSFSATIPNNLVSFLNKYLEKHILIDLVGKELKKENINHYFLQVKALDKDKLLLDVLKAFNPYLCLIFCNTKESVNNLALKLTENNIKVSKLTGDLPARNRKQELKRIKDGVYQFVVCSDIASRGLDIVGVSHVINYELPKEIEFYIHRIGRTARFDSTGLAITLYDYEDYEYIKRLKEKNIEASFMNLKDGILEVTKRKNISKKSDSLEYKLNSKFPVSKVVKPGHKKKRKELIEKVLRDEKRKKLEKIYKNRNSKK